MIDGRRLVHEGRCWLEWVGLMHLVGDPYTSEEILAVVERHYGRGKHNTRGVRALEYDLWESPVVMSHAERCRIQYLRKLDLLNSELAVIGDA